MTLPTLFNSDNIFDVFFKDFFNDTSPFLQIDSCNRSDVSYPVNVIKNKDNAEFNISCIGLDKKDVNISVDSDMLRVSYDKSHEVDNKEYIYKGITNRSFNLGWKISKKYDLSKISAKMDKGMLVIKIPISEERKPKLIDVAIE